MPLYPSGQTRIPLRKNIGSGSRSVLGPPDVYPQDKDQKEDELNAVHVKQGFTQSYAALVREEEYSSMVSKNDNMVNTNKVLADLKNIMTKKEVANELNDSGRRKQSINTRDPWLVTGRNKPAVDNWLRELACNRRSFSALLMRKVPIFNKKEEMLANLCEFEVPTPRAVWYIKMKAAYDSAISEMNKTKKRPQHPDPSQDWTHALTRYLRDQLQEILTSSNDEVRVESSVPFKQWTYSLELCEHMYNQGLLDRHEFLQWVLEMVEKYRKPDADSWIAMRIVLPVVLTYAKEMCKTQTLARKMAYQCAKKIYYLVEESDAISGNNQNEHQQNQNPNMHPVVSAFLELTNDQYTRFIILGLSSVLQMITLECPSAMVYHYFGENKSPSSLLGSPLDHLPNCAPSGLPMSNHHSNAENRHRIRMSELLIKERSKQVEEKWSADPNQSLGKIGPRVDKNLSVLEVLDSFNFDKLEMISDQDCLQKLYEKLFKTSSSASSSSPASSGSHGDVDDDIIVHTLCEWAVTSMRSGEHRSFVVAKLLERKQSEWIYQQNGGQSESATGDNENDDKNSESDMYMNMNIGTPLFQNQLFQYLDMSAPKMDNPLEFSNLVLLFHELICYDVFSHDAYLCSLISRGDVLDPISDSSKDHEKSNQSDEAENSFDDKIDGDLNNILNQIKEGNQLSDPFSPTSDREKDKNDSMNGLPDVSKKGRHWQYVYHFPLPQDESSTHDCNQRNVLLYGVGRGRDDASRNVKKIMKEITKLFSQKFSINVSDGGKPKKDKNVRFEDIAQKFQNLSYYDQHCVSQQCGQTMIEMLSAFANSNANYLPVHEYVSFLFDITGLALNIQGLLDWCVQILKELPGVESQLVDRGSRLTRKYTTELSLYIVGVLRRYHTIFLLNPSDVITAFEQLKKVATKPISELSGGRSGTYLDCNSAEWCIFSYLNDLTEHSKKLKNDEEDQKWFIWFYSSNRENKRRLKDLNDTERNRTLTENRFGVHLIANPRNYDYNAFNLNIQQLRQNPQNQYNLVCNVLMEVCGCNDNDKLNDIAILCCEFTAQCPSLSSEWLAALTTLCNSGSSYQDLLSQIDVSNQSNYNRLGIFVSILIARQCFQLQDFVKVVAINSLIKTYGEVQDGMSTIQTELGARLTCHLLLMLFQTVEGTYPNLNQQQSSLNGSGIKHSCDRQFLAFAQRYITIPALIAALKVMLVLGDPPSKEEGSRIYNVDEDELSDFAKHILKKICSQKWVHNRCLQSSNVLLQKDVLLDDMLSSKQAQKLLRLICMQNGNLPEISDDSTSNKPRNILTKILENVDEWNLRISTVDINLMYIYTRRNGDDDGEAWLDEAAQAIVDIFRLNENSDIEQQQQPMEIDSNNESQHHNRKKAGNSNRKVSSVWIIPYLVRNLKFLQSKVLKVSSEILEGGNWSKAGGGTGAKGGARSTGSYGGASGRKDLNNQSNSKNSQDSANGHQPFLQLVLTCLRELDSGSDSKKLDLDSKKQDLLESLKDQFQTRMVELDTKADKYEDPYARKSVQDALQLRFSLVGGVFDTICRNSTHIKEWATLLVQLVVRGIVDLTNNSDLFTTVLDMINILIHSTLIQDRETGSQERSEENRKHYNYHNLVKTLKKEIGEKNNPSVKYLKQLLPLPKMMTEVICTETYGTMTEKGNKVKGLNSDKKPGMQVSEKQKLSPWDILEGHKTPAPLSWTWFGAVKHERKPMRYEEGFHELKYASLAMEKPKSYYQDPPPLPPEDLEPQTQNKETNKMGDPNNIRGGQGGMMMHGGPGGMNPTGMPYYNNPNMMGGGTHGQGNFFGGNQHPGGMGGSGGGFNPQGQRMPYMNDQMGGAGGARGWAGGPGQRAPMPGGPRGPFMGMGANNMGNQPMGNMGGGAGGPMSHHQMMAARGARPMMGPSGQGLPTGARPMMTNQGMYGGPGGQPNQGMYGGGGAGQPNQPMMSAGPSGAAPGYGSPQQYAQPPYHSPNMQGSMAQRFPGGPQGGPQRNIGGNPNIGKQALQDMLRARHTDPQFSSGPGSNFVPPPGRTTFQMRPTMTRMPQNTMYGSSGGNQGQYSNAGPGGGGGQQGGPSSGPGGPNSGSYGGGNFPNQNPNQYPYNMMNQQNQQGNQPQRPPYQMPQMRPQNMQGYPMGAGQRNPNPGGPSANYGMNMAGGSQGNYRAQMSSNQMNQQNMMRMQNPQLIAQLSRGPNNMNPQQQQQQQQMGGYGGQQNRFQ